MTELEQVEIQINMAKKMIALRDTYFKLAANPHFKDVVEEGYFKEEAARLVMAKSSNLSKEQKETIDGMILGVGGFANYLDMIVRRGNEMEMALKDHESTREEILAEEIGQSQGEA